MSPSASSGSSDDDWCLPDYVHMLLLWSEGEGSKRVLMLKQNSSNTWDLPFFTYPDSLKHGGDRCAADLERLLMVSALPDRRAFAVVAELLGSHGGRGLTGGDPIGFSRLMLIDAQIALRDLNLPPKAEWKEASFVASLLESLDSDSGNRPALEVTLKYLYTTSNLIAETPDPRYRFGWFNSAVIWLKTEVERHGEIPAGKVVQKLVSSSAKLLSLECLSGTFYLKAPALGCEEISITAAVASLFPENTADVIATSEELHSLIMRGFDHIIPGKGHHEAFVKTLGNIQLQSLQHLDTLKAAGCEDRGPKLIAEKLHQWTKEEETRRTFGFRSDTWETFVSIVVDMCSRLAAYNIPLTLVHGDCDGRNAAVVGTNVASERPGLTEESDEKRYDGIDHTEKILFFDWQYACISHPFCDLHELHKELSDDVLNMYFDLWSTYESRDRAREAFELAKNVGWCLKMWVSVDCFQQCDLQRNSSTADFVFDVYCMLNSRISNISPPAASTDGSPECSKSAAAVND